MTHKNFHHHFLPHSSCAKASTDAKAMADKSEGQAPSGTHHRAHALSLGALFVYLQILVVVSAGIYFLRLTSPAILGTATFSAQQIIDLTNQKRAEANLGQLSASPMLETAARAKAANMFAENYWAHFAPSGKTPWTFITVAGYKYLFAGENLARDFTDASAVVDAWMGSPSHRGNIMDKNYKEIGVAVVDGKLTGREGILVVQMFGASSVLPTEQNGLPPFAEASGGKQFTVDSQTIASNNSATVLASQQFPISKGIALGLVGFIFVLFLIETFILLKRSRVHLGGGVLAHIILLGFLLLVVWYSVSGAIV
ncbi:MAG: CAP domain-containing protein [Candidatus Curtissbacteria bacterium]